MSSDSYTENPHGLRPSVRPAMTVVIFAAPLPLRPSLNHAPRMSSLSNQSTVAVISSRRPSILPRTHTRTHSQPRSSPIHTSRTGLDVHTSGSKHCYRFFPFRRGQGKSGPHLLSLSQRRADGMIRGRRPLPLAARAPEPGACGT